MQFTATPVQSLGRAAFGVLRCSCAAYPVVDGVPILQRTLVGVFEHTSGASASEGVSPDDLIAWIVEGHTDRALVRCLLATSPTRWRIWRRWQEQRKIARFLASRDRWTGRDAIRFLFGPPRIDLGLDDYFLYRFSQPRFLAALSLASNLPAGDRPVLDLACGIGHLAHYLTRRNPRSAVVGLDMNFDHVWIARHWVAPEASYVCANVADGLPFVANAFSGVVVSDAYHYFPSRQGLMREVDRVAPGQPLLLTRVGNRDVMPNEGDESTLRGYLAELAPGPCRVFSEDRLVRTYLERDNPLAGTDESEEGLVHCKWLTFARNLEPRSPEPGCEWAWPHAVGRIALNPIYRQHDTHDGRQLRFQFPGTWFAYENHRMLEYHPRRALLAQDDLAALSTGRWTAGLDTALRQFVLVGLPERY
jgi:SAM-dependent methyltransferase